MNELGGPLQEKSNFLSKKGYIIMGILLFVGALLAIAVMTSKISNTNKEIRQLEKEIEENDKARDSIKRLYFQEGRYRMAEKIRGDSFQIIANNATYKEQLLNKKLREVKGSYKRYSDDSLIKELIHQYEISTGIDIKLRK